MMKRVLFAAGGTMGHIGPALAIATALKEIEPEVEITFVGTKSGLESGLELAFPLRTIAKVPLPRRVDLQLLTFPFKFFLSLVQSLRIVRGHEVIVGFGGYVCTPVYIAAKILGKDLIVHEANALPGFANRVGRSLGAETFTNFENVARLWCGEAIGIPLRKEIIDLARRKSGIDARGKSHTILVMGGSQGSAAINQVIWSVVEILPPNVKILHAVGGRNLEEVPTHLLSDRYRGRYQVTGYIEDVARAYEEADLVIARAGAVTCAEIRALSKRSILVPLGHGNGEQAENARQLVREGFAIAVSDDQFSSSWLMENLERAFQLNPPLGLDPRLDATASMVEAIRSRWNNR
jgi:UDP-N-acetylglucosamine--N-acetylmuramyl-(pentapeptide) pyrophosphoryl-undecaprenol N-acetylglucosamine transferase